MILGIGVDLAEVARFRKTSSAFRRRVFTSAELAYARRYRDTAERLAGRFAAKEAAMKALGTGWAKGVAWREVEVCRGKAGQPVLQLSGAAAKRAKALGIRRWHLSISHAGGVAVAVAVGER